jgi:hypothetical protein
MGLESAGAGMLGRESGVARFGVPPQTSGRDEPIRKVNAVVQAVLAEQFGRREPQREGECQVFLDKLMSVRQADLLPPGTRVVQVAATTVVTPLAHERLKKRGIAIRLGAAVDAWCPAPAPGQWAFAIGDQGGLAQAMRRSFLEDSRAWIELDSSLEAITAWLAGGEGRGAMWMTCDVALAVWRSCRREGVRAASAAELADVRGAVRSLGMNLLIVDSTGKSISWIKQLASAFRLGGAPLAPEPILVEAAR